MERVFVHQKWTVGPNPLGITQIDTQWEEGQSCKITFLSSEEIVDVFIGEKGKMPKLPMKYQPYLDKMTKVINDPCHALN